MVFKRYKNPFEKDLSSNFFEDSYETTTLPLGRQSMYTTATPLSPSTEVPPRMFEEKSSIALNPLNFEQTALSKDKLSDEIIRRETSFMRKSNGLQVSLPSEEPDTTLGEGVVFRGELTFKSLLRIDGHFEGELISPEGKLVIGPTGIVKANLKMREAIIEGLVEGNISLSERLELRSKAKVQGNIETPSLIVDEGVTIIGHVSVKSKD